MRKVVAFVAATVVAVVGMASMASAHVTIDPDSAQQGAGDQVLTFRVPNEETNANTVKVDTQFPTDHPIASVDVLTPPPGWTAQVTTTHLTTPIVTDDGTFSDVVSEIVWSGGSIPPGQFGEFTVLAQGLPKGVNSIAFPTIQTYSDGSTVSWIDPTVAGQPAPDHPAPVLTLTAAAADSGSATTTSSPSGAAVSATVVKKETNNTLGIIAVILGALGLIFGAVALARTRGRQPSTPQPSSTSPE